MTRRAIRGARIFDGERFLDGHAIVLEDGRIAAVTPARKLDPAIEVEDVRGLVAPGFVDLQVNGGGGVLFNATPTVEGIRAIGAAHRRFGTTAFLPTVITDARERMAEAMEAVRDGIAAGLPGLVGIHCEGPFINPARKGVHDARHIRPITAADIAVLTRPGAGRVLVTLAPEMASLTAIAALARAGIRVAAGHTTAAADICAAARRAGMTGYTHLFNAMPPMAGRDPGPVGAALAERSSWCGLIVDRHHVSATALRAALAARGTERMVLVTDAMPSVGSDADTFDLLGRTVTRSGGRLTTADGTLAGSDLDMASAVKNTVEWLDVPLGDALRMASAAPAAFLGLDAEMGRIAPGYRADLVLLDEALGVRRTWIGGDGLSEEREAA